jgi:pentapeptide MXKDX repeat protein
MKKLTASILSPCILLAGASVMAEDAMKNKGMAKNGMMKGEMKK